MIADENLARLILREWDARFLPEPDSGFEIAPARVFGGFRLFAFRVDGFEFQFGSVRADCVVVEVRQRAPEFVVRFRPAFDREKEILLDLSTGVLHAVTHFHRREFLVEIDRELLVLDRDVCRFLLVGGGRVPGHRHADLPGPAIGE